MFDALVLWGMMVQPLGVSSRRGTIGALPGGDATSCGVRLGEFDATIAAGPCGWGNYLAPTVGVLPPASSSIEDLVRAAGAYVVALDFPESSDAIDSQIDQLVTASERELAKTRRPLTRRQAR